jgi:metal-responsive CopG/Arc/MetJ family transcriptional regulator
MAMHAMTPQQLAALAALASAPARKAKTSVTLSSNLLKVIDRLAGSNQRSAWIEIAVRSYTKRELRRERRARELELLNRHAAALNAEGDESATYQAAWDVE